MARGSGVGYFPSPREIRLWYNFSRLVSYKICSPRQAFSRRTECIGTFQNILFPFSHWKKEGIFLPYSWGPSRLLEVKLTNHWVLSPHSLRTGSPGVSDSQTCPHWGSSNFSIAIQVFMPQNLFLRQFLLQWVVILSICFCLQYNGQWFTLWPHFFDGSKNSCFFFFLVCSAFVREIFQYSFISNYHFIHFVLTARRFYNPQIRIEISSFLTFMYFMAIQIELLP